MSGFVSHLFVRQPVVRLAWFSWSKTRSIICRSEEAHINLYLGVKRSSDFFRNLYVNLMEAEHSLDTLSPLWNIWYMVRASL